MSETKELTYSDVSAHTTKKDLYMVIHDNVYNASSFVDEHPGGEEVLLDVGGQDATEAFEDVGHSDEARELLKGMYVAKLKRQEGDPAPRATATATTSSSGTASESGGLGVAAYVLIIAGGALAYFAYSYMQTQQSQKA
ncbi:hypothetical protein AMS68_007654 [Peltaster fructicola]|uniref:Cytochrome b5 heme-binding domain-containing protein n=1 Tax=Peltaster fructicola TaxID=286661 RepID=A0A6H0Y519_9PEZI|nr:hypothetical protein AMS68_007654 [Peltaster fructicola]